MRGGRAAEVIATLILLLGMWLGFATSGLPAIARREEAPAPGQFVVSTALHDLQVISATPHPVGTVAHDRVRDYLVDRLRANGLVDVHVQSATGFNTLDGPIAATVANVMGRIRGTTREPALLLMAHYDAVPGSFGAGDDGSGVVALLETARALANDPAPHRDVIVVFTDAEEEGLLGAEAFVDLHPWARDVGVVLNFDARGDQGPVYMFQTSPGNSALIRAIAAGVPDARTNSLTGEVYRHLPSDTDLSIWLHSDFSVGALNFAPVGGYTHYHTPIDNIASLDPRIVQQMGDYAMGIAQALDRVDVRSPRTSDAIYFTAPLVGLIRYPASWALMLGIDSVAIVLVVLGLGLHRRTLTMRGIGTGAMTLVLSLGIPAIVTLAGWRVISAMHPAYREILQGDPYNSSWYLLAFGAFTVAVVVELQRRASLHVTPLEIAVAPAIACGVIGLVLARLLPGASYLFAWPLFAAATAASWWRRSERRDQVPSAALPLLALPVLLLWPPLIRALETALTVRSLVLCALLLAFALSLISLPLQLAGRARTWIVRLALVVAIGALARAEAGAGFSARQKRPDSLAQLVDADSSRAWWVSFDHGVDPWTARVLGDHPARRTFSRFGIVQDALIEAPVAGTVPVPASPVVLLDNNMVASGHAVHLRITQSAPGEFVALYGDSGATVSGMTINGRVLQDGAEDRYRPQYHVTPSGTILRYYGVPEEGIDLHFTIREGTAAFRVVTVVPGLPATANGPVASRPDAMMSKPFVPTDMTFTGWTITL